MGIMSDTGNSSHPQVTARIESEDTNDATDLSIEISRQASDETPAFVTITFTNIGETVRDFPFGVELPFPPIRGTREDGDKRLHLVTHDGTIDGAEYPTGYSEFIPETPTEGCWRVAGDYTKKEARGALAWVAQPGSYLSRDYVVLDDEDTEDCMPKGEYRFSVSWEEETPEGNMADYAAEIVLGVD